MNTGRLVYATYADGGFVRNFAANARAIRRFGGADAAILITRAELEASPTYAAHREVFDARRGAGYYAWKPWAILEALGRCGPDDVLLYHDCGTGLRYKTLLYPRELIAIAREHGFVAGVRCPQYGPNRRWNRAACLAATGCTDPRFLDVPTVEASISIWTNTAPARAFLRAWLGYCLDLEVIRDARPDELPHEDPTFIEHRYDQAVLTNLATLHDAAVIDPLPASLPFAKSVTLLEVDQRARKSRFYAALHALITRAATLNRKRRGP